MGKPKGYVDANGQRLFVGRGDHFWYVCWSHTQAEASSVCALFDWPWMDSAVVDDDVSLWELRTSYRCVGAAEGIGSAGRFKTRKQALAARDMANQALFEGKGKPWPEWAKKAKEAGWKVPRGWKP